MDTGSADGASPDTGSSLLRQDTMAVLGVERGSGHVQFYCNGLNPTMKREALKTVRLLLIKLMFHWTKPCTLTQQNIGLLQGVESVPQGCWSMLTPMLPTVVFKLAGCPLGGGHFLTHRGNY